MAMELSDRVALGQLDKVALGQLDMDTVDLGKAVDTSDSRWSVPNPEKALLFLQELFPRRSNHHLSCHHPFESFVVACRAAEFLAESALIAEPPFADVDTPAFGLAFGLDNIVVAFAFVAE